MLDMLDYNAKYIGKIALAADQKLQYWSLEVITQHDNNLLGPSMENSIEFYAWTLVLVHIISSMTAST